MKKTLWIFGLATLVAMGAYAQTTTNPVIVASATGSGINFLGGDNVVRAFAFTAQKDSSGERGASATGQLGFGGDRHHFD